MSAHQCRGGRRYLAVILNSLDNFTHGMAVSASYCISVRVGMVTTLTVLLHEVPHEVITATVLCVGARGLPQPLALAPTCPLCSLLWRGLPRRARV